MSKGSSPQNVTTTSSAEPSEFIRPYLEEAINYGQDLFQSDTPNFFPNNTYVDPSAATNASLDLATARAVAGNPLLNQSQNLAQQTLAGDFLSPTTNPYSQGLFNQMADDVTSKVQSQFSKAGRLGSGANQEILSDSLGRLANQVYGDQFNRERALQAQTMMTAPQLGEMDYNDISRLAQVGADRESIDQTKLQDAIARFDYEQQKPFLKLNQYLGALGSPVPTQTVSTQPVFRNTGAGLLGGALTGANIAGQIGGASMFGNPLFGAIGGGLLGGYA
tara:strand:+ start:1727 stop:2557 length:831 start_codon:yes stop_codon:yes gene_type:complete